MEKSILYLVFIKFLLLFHGNYRVVNANPLVGDNVIPAQDGELPFVVSLGADTENNTSKHFCTGTFIGKKYVLTAAHCTMVNNQTAHFMHPSRIVATIGSINVNQGTKYKVKTWKTFTNWVAEKNINLKQYPRLSHDIAVITLEDAVKNIKPAHISNLRMTHLYGQTVVAAGWGKSNFLIMPTILQKAELRILTRKQCLANSKARGSKMLHVLNHLCTASNPLYPQISLGCGDSGGPLLINGDELVGVSDFTCAHHGDPYLQNMHISVRFYRKFIRDVIDC